jgi:hypothetical protein
MARAARLSVLLHSRSSTPAPKVASTMDGIGDTAAPYLGPSENMQGYAGLAFAAFVLKHGGCRGELIESRLGEDLLAC